MNCVAPQNRHVQSVAQAFLDVHWDRKSPLLLGYSGGPDSKALLHAFLACGVRPHLAHVDHGWREESREEVEILRQEAKTLNCPFFTTRLSVEKTEDAARKGRFQFFTSLFPGYQALILAHQAEDLAETVLKRVLEGAHLSHLGGMKPVSIQYGIPIWRPFLKVEKREILSFLEQQSIGFFVDSTNLDPSYLRARMRLEIFPFLNKMFGKETVGNLLLLSERAYELKQYLDERVNSVAIHEGPWGTLIDLNSLSPLEQRHLIQKQVSLSRDQLETLLEWVKKGVTSRQLVSKGKKILVDKGRICMISLTAKD